MGERPQERWRGSESPEDSRQVEVSQGGGEDPAEGADKTSSGGRTGAAIGACWWGGGAPATGVNCAGLLALDMPAAKPDPAWPPWPIYRILRHAKTHMTSASLAALHSCRGMNEYRMNLLRYVDQGRPPSPRTIRRWQSHRIHHQRG